MSQINLITVRNRSNFSVFHLVTLEKIHRFPMVEGFEASRYCKRFLTELGDVGFRPAGVNLACD